MNTGVFNEKVKSFAFPKVVQADNHLSTLVLNVKEGNSTLCTINLGGFATGVTFQFVDKKQKGTILDSEI